MNNDPLLQLILDNPIGDNLIGSLGEKLINSATAIKAKSAPPPSIKSNKVSIDYQKKINTYKNIEDNGNLLWCEYPVWNGFTHTVRETISIVLDPLFWCGVYFPYDQFIFNEQTIFQDMDHNSVVIMARESTRVRMYSVWLYGHTDVDNLGFFKFKDFMKKLGTSAIRLYGKSGRRSPLIIKEIKQKPIKDL